MAYLRSEDEQYQRRWDAFLRNCPQCSRCGGEITDLPYLRWGEVILCRACVFRSMVDTEEI